MSRYIKADDLIDMLHKQFPNDGFYNDKYWDSNRVLRAIGDTPTADVRENVKGEWVYHKNDMACVRWDKWECSACHNRQEIETTYCPYCGADMRGEE